ncbi:hypothetical protein [Jiella mangrovi]|uniref:Uncharacterized protein n=1 Tax=Jiella mangrovi TaxID=2821407 RepID=A0ABS4BFE4_9HYPH|nr:hypothetical protein [Jiella mangrovi]MBP0615483.1 hypothetical protein [Jiella mangrovi]
MIVLGGRRDVRGCFLRFGRGLARRGFDRFDTFFEKGEIRLCLLDRLGAFEEREVGALLVFVVIDGAAGFGCGPVIVRIGGEFSGNYGVFF